MSAFFTTHHEELFLCECDKLDFVDFTVCDELFLEEGEDFAHGSLKVGVDFGEIKISSVLFVVFVALFEDFADFVDFLVLYEHLQVLVLKLRGPEFPIRLFGSAILFEDVLNVVNTVFVEFDFGLFEGQDVGVVAVAYILGFLVGPFLQVAFSLQDFCLACVVEVDYFLVGQVVNFVDFVQGTDEFEVCSCQSRTEDLLCVQQRSLEQCHVVVGQVTWVVALDSHVSLSLPVHVPDHVL